MTLQEKIQAQETVIEALRDARWNKLAKARKRFVAKEKENVHASTDAWVQEHREDLCMGIDEGYLSLLKSIVKVSKERASRR